MWAQKQPKTSFTIGLAVKKICSPKSPSHISRWDALSIKNPSTNFSSLCTFKSF